MTINPPISQTADRDALIDSQGQYLQDYRKALESELTKLTSRALSAWTKQSDAAFRQLLKEAVDIATKQILAELNSSLASNLSKGSLGSSSSSPSFSNALSGFIASEVNDLLSSTRTRTSSNESARSSDARNDFRLSRSQQQAQIARDAAQGQRNL